MADNYNGGAILGIAGKNCVAMGCDLRLGQQMTTVGMNFQKIFKIQDNILLGLAGLATDCLTLHSFLKYRVNMYNLTQGKNITPTAFCYLFSSVLYERRWAPYYISPIVCGLENGKPIIGHFDLIGCLSISENFGACGTAGTMLKGVAETFFKKGMDAEKLEEMTAQVLTSGVDRDASSGWGGLVFVLTEKTLKIKSLKVKMT